MNTAAATCAFLTITSQLAVVPQYDAYCGRNPSACERIEVTNERVHLDEKMFNMIQSVNAQINHSVKLINDIDLYKTEEYWTMAGKKGDCEDVAILKQRILEQKGIEKSNLILTIVYDENKEGHVVLTVRTNKGDYVLDIKTDNVVLWSRRPYEYLMSQSPDDRNIWYVTENICEINGNQTITGSYRSR